MVSVEKPKDRTEHRDEDYGTGDVLLSDQAMTAHADNNGDDPQRVGCGFCHDRTLSSTITSFHSATPGDSTLGQIVGRDFDGDIVTG